MKFAIIHPDATGRYDPPGEGCVRHIPNRVDDPKEADVLLMPVARFDGFVFDQKLYDISKPWVLIDWCEFGWGNPMKTSYLWGRDRLSHPSFQDPEWAKFDKFVLDHPPIMQFQRELLKTDVNLQVQPIDYLNWLPLLGNDTKEDFLKRPLEVSFNFGRSHEGRMWFHGSVFRNAGRFGYDVISEFAHLERGLQENGLKWLSVHVPHYARIDAREIQRINRQAIVTVVLPGAGEKTFRLAENCADGVMAIPDSPLASAYPWGPNACIPLPQLKSPEDADEAVKRISDSLMMRESLYDIYLNAMDNSLNYQPLDYMRRHVAAKIESLL